MADFKSPWAKEVSKALIERKAKLWLQTLALDSQSICGHSLVHSWAGELLLPLESSLAVQVGIFRVGGGCVFFLFPSSPLSPKIVCSSPFPFPALRKISQKGLMSSSYRCLSGCPSSVSGFIYRLSVNRDVFPSTSPPKVLICTFTQLYFSQGGAVKECP